MAGTLPAHSYLGDLRDLPGRTPLLETGMSYQIPVVPFDDTIVCPGDVFPLRVTDPRLRQILRVAMDAPAPTSRLIAAVMFNSTIPVLRGRVPLTFEPIACTLEVVKQSSDGTSMLALALQRVVLDFDNSPRPVDFERISVHILSDALERPLPFSTTANQTAFPQFVYKIVDPTTLCKAAQKLLVECVPNQKPADINDPIYFSYNLVRNLPFNSSQRRFLLQTPLVTERLTKEIQWIKEMEGLYCRGCYHKIAEINDLVQINDEGIGGHYVNSHGASHDMLTLKNAAVRIVSDPETENSWFAGYAWQIAYCQECTEHLGWCFTKVGGETGGEARDDDGSVGGGSEASRSRSLPPIFFGIRTAAMDNKDTDQMRTFFHDIMNFANGVEIDVESEGEDEEEEDDEEERSESETDSGLNE